MTDNTFIEPKRARRIRDKQRMKRRARWVAKNVSPGTIATAS